MSADHQRFNLTNRECYPDLLPQHFSDVDSGQRCIICKIKNLFIACLKVKQSGELMSVTETEF